MTDKEISYYIRNAWNTKDFSDPHVDDAIAAATDANRDALNANRAVDLELAGDIRVLQHREDEARALYAASLQRSEQANLPGLAVREIAQLEERKDPQAAIKLLRTEVDKSESRHWGRATPALTLRWTLAQKYEFAGMLPDAGEQYKAIFDRAGSSYPFRSIGIIGYADALAQMGRRKEALGMIDSWIKLNESNDPAWEFMPWALNVRAEAETDLKEQEADYTFARRIASSNLQERARYLTDHPTAAQRLWRAKATAELGLAKVLFFKRQFSASDDFMDAALRTCKASGDASLERWVHKQRFVKS
jgi:tetratricopeptide (TPR) repeat protein